MGVLYPFYEFFQKDSIMADILIVGMEGGSSSTVTTLFDSNGATIAETTRAPTNPWLYGGIEAVATLIMEHIEATLQSANLPPSTPITAAGLALSGIDTEEQALSMKRLLEKKRANTLFKIVNDTQAGLACLDPRGGPRITVISGTGSNAAFLSGDETKPVHCGGWSYLLGDQGSAYWIVSLALRTIIEDRDGYES